MTDHQAAHQAAPEQGTEPTTEPAPEQHIDTTTVKSPRLYRPELPPPPPRIAKLPLHRGYPVPWFVAWVDGAPEFRVMDGKKLVEAIKYHRCWVCGERMGAHSAFVVGPMCVVNRTSSEPPAHLTCALYSAQACPFLTRPHMERRDAGLPDGTTQHSAAIMRNPGVAIVYVTRSYEVFNAGEGRILIRMGSPTSLEAFAEGRRATPAEIAESIRTGLPALEAMAKSEGAPAMRELEVLTKTAAAALGLPSDWQHERRALPAPAAALDASDPHQAEMSL